MSLVYKADPVRGAEWKVLLAEKAPELPFRIWPDTGDPARVKYAAVWEPPRDMLALFPNLELVLSVGAGVDQFDLSTVPAEIPLVRMLDPGIVDGMVEYCALAALALHRNFLDYMADKSDARWQPIRIIPASRRKVGIMGLGQLGGALCHRLMMLGFRVSGWSRSERSIEGVECFHGADMLSAFLAGADILVCLLPLTNETKGILDARLFASLPKGAALISVGRGGHLLQGDLLAALASVQLSGAFLDVTEPEPLPKGHPLWSHPRVFITPHIASMTQPETAVDFVLETIDSHRRGLPLRGLVDRTRGY
jgi:glyoxylate/hydroxypyruvate reductase A